MKLFDFNQYKKYLYTFHFYEADNDIHNEEKRIGTIAKYVANMNVDVVDLGVPVLSMHAPFEIVSKVDVYMAYRAFHTFFTK